MPRSPQVVLTTDCVEDHKNIPAMVLTRAVVLYRQKQSPLKQAEESPMQPYNHHPNPNTDPDISLRSAHQNTRHTLENPRRKALSQRMFAHWVMIDGVITCQWEWDR